MREADLQQLVAQVCEHLYDLVYLRTHPLREMLVGDEESLNAHDAAWKLHHLLLDAIDELDPGPQAPLHGREWRRHQLLVLRYVEGLSPDVVARRLNISERSYFREQRAALTALASVLSHRLAERQQRDSSSQTSAPADRLGLLRMEAARAWQAQRTVAVAPVVEGVLATLQDRLAQQRLTIQLSLSSGLPELTTDAGLLRQLLLGMLGYLAERAQSAVVYLGGQASPEHVELTLRVQPGHTVRPPMAGEASDCLAGLRELAALGRITFVPVMEGSAITGFVLSLPLEAERPVLVVDDNAQAVELYQRYLAAHGYRTLSAHSAQEALAALAEVHPRAVLLDVMMAGQDGWDLLQILRNRPDTQHIPLIVCSVLRQRELALSLGATAFLEKPVTEQALLAMLKALE